MRTCGKEDIMTDRQIIISIGRECGSGGHEIGEKLAAYFGIKLYDRSLIELLAEKKGQDPDTLAKMEEKVKSTIFPVRRNGFAERNGEIMNKMTNTDKIYLMERDLILDLARTESFVIIGRAANAILADHPNALRLYVYASDSFKIPRVKEYYHLNSDAEAKKKMEQVDKMRQNYFNYYSNMEWGSSDGHDFMIDTSVFGIDGAVDIIIDITKRKFPQYA